MVSQMLLGCPAVHQTSLLAATERSPRIVRLAWGSIEVEGFGRFRDAKIYPGGAKEWDWRETGTRHVPGIQPADVEELLVHEPTSIILSQGMLKRLKVCPETLELLEQRGVRSHVLATAEAVALFNERRAHERITGLFHTTC
jgi:hypothetical protein